jgi:hypothetical protein
MFYISFLCIFSICVKVNEYAIYFINEISVMKMLCMQNWAPGVKFKSRKRSLIYEKMFVVRLNR